MECNTNLNNVNYSATSLGSNVYGVTTNMTAGNYTYYWISYGSGEKNNMMQSSTRTYTVSSAGTSNDNDNSGGGGSGGSSGGSGGGSGDTSNSHWLNTYDLSSSSVDSGINYNLANKERIQINVLGETHYIGVVSSTMILR